MPDYFLRVDEQGNLNRHNMDTITSGVSNDVDTRIAATADVLRRERRGLYSNTMRQVNEKDSTVKNDLLNGPIRALEIGLVDLNNDFVNNTKFRLASHGENCPVGYTHELQESECKEYMRENLPFLDPRRSYKIQTEGDRSKGCYFWRGNRDDIFFKRDGRTSGEPNEHQKMVCKRST